MDDVQILTLIHRTFQNRVGDIVRNSNIVVVRAGANIGTDARSTQMWSVWRGVGGLYRTGRRANEVAVYGDNRGEDRQEPGEPSPSTGRKPEQEGSRRFRAEHDHQNHEYQRENDENSPTEPRKETAEKRPKAIHHATVLDPDS